MKVLVTGSGGFVGTRLVPHLAAAGHWVVAQTGRRDGGAAQAFRTIHRSPDQLDADDFRGVEAVVHLAAIAGRDADRESYQRINTELPARLLDVASSAGVRSFVFLSSAKVHGDRSAVPYHADSARRPTDDYGRSKAAAEDLLHARRGDIAVTVLRPPLVYGTGAKGNVALLHRVASSGLPLPVPASSNQRSFLDVETLCRAVDGVLALDHGFRAFVLDDGRPRSTADFYAELATELGRDGRTQKIPTAAFRAADRVLQRFGRPHLSALYHDFWTDDRRLWGVLDERSEASEATATVADRATDQPAEATACW